MLKVFILGLMPLLANAQTPEGDDTPRAHPTESVASFSSVVEATQSIADRPLYEAVLIVEQTPRPEDNGGNVFLAGFLEMDSNGLPAAGLIPSDYQQLGVWVQTWPYRREVQLVDGLYYYVQYGYSEAPSVEDRVSNYFSVDSQPTEPIQVNISLDSPYGSVQAQDDGPGRDPSLLDVAVDGLLTVNFDPAPSELGGSIFLTGFDNVDATSGMPDRGSDPVDFYTVVTELDSTPFESEVSLVPGLHYFAMYGQGIHPEPENRMSTGSLFSEGDSSLVLTIGQLTTPAEGGGNGAPPVAQSSASNTPPETTTNTPSSPQSVPTMMEEMVRDHVKKWAGIALIGGLLIGSFVGWFFRGRRR